MEMTQNELQKQRINERKYVMKIQYLARQGIAIIGDNGNDNLRQLLKLLCKTDSDIIMRRLDNESTLH